ncbi:hypothetical protein EJ05DRAFT_477462 [Pseudovirgaria hyperparasitica]|uniref:Uncharacterized protein n=1 Tax=Pseudovirgaria hyperparasitica TaxID=470096 RepID=A0A6A6W5N4_9PEZI|nr:uncharacterized protein EJ05DRAFT_477462 [Pseudovirgaria hyperparasitica]KAF2757250.1 hypothetical protein EJ05DRAFT_477462 [Pseudovirgaria hyperparasitica]
MSSVFEPNTAVQEIRQGSVGFARAGARVRLWRGRSTACPRLITGLLIPHRAYSATIKLNRTMAL